MYPSPTEGRLGGPQGLAMMNELPGHSVFVDLRVLQLVTALPYEFPQPLQARPAGAPSEKGKSLKSLAMDLQAV